MYVYVWDSCDVSLGMSGDPNEELVARTLAEARKLARSSDQGAGIMCWAHPVFCDTQLSYLSQVD